VFEIDLHVTERTHDFACTCLVPEVLAPEPPGRIWVTNHFPDYQLDHERERRLQTVIAVRRLRIRQPAVLDRPSRHRRHQRVLPQCRGGDAHSVPSDHYGLVVDLASPAARPEGDLV